MIWEIDPIIFSIGAWSLHWYSVFFGMALIAGFVFMESAFRSRDLNREFLLFVPFGFIGPMVGGRLAHFAFYEPNGLILDPLHLFNPVGHPGLASHGAILGLLLATWLYTCWVKIDIWWLIDRICTGFLFVGGVIRIGNFFRSELVGVPVVSSWGVVFKLVDDIPRHPVQLYEAAAYFILFTLFFALGKGALGRTSGIITGLVICLVATFRFTIEFLKEGERAELVGIVLRTSQWLSIPFFFMGLCFIILRWKRIQTS